MFFKCDFDNCNKLFNCKKALKEHNRTHDDDRPYKWYVLFNLPIREYDLIFVILAKIVINRSSSFRHFRNMLESMIKRGPMIVHLMTAKWLFLK